MENTLTVNERSALNKTVLFIVCALLVTAAGTAITYCSGVLNGMSRLPQQGYNVPSWIMITILPVLFFHLGVSLFFVLKNSPASAEAKTIRNWSVTLLAVLFTVLCIMPFLMFNGMMTAAFALNCTLTSLSIALAIMDGRYSMGSTIINIPFIIVSALLVLFTGYMAFM